MDRGDPKKLQQHSTSALSYYYLLYSPKNQHLSFFFSLQVSHLSTSELSPYIPYYCSFFHQCSLILTLFFHPESFFLISHHITTLFRHRTVHLRHIRIPVTIHLSSHLHVLLLFSLSTHINGFILSHGNIHSYNVHIFIMYINLYCAYTYIVHILIMYVYLYCTYTYNVHILILYIYL